MRFPLKQLADRLGTGSHVLLGGDANADSIMDRLVQNAIQVYTGETNMRQLLSPHPLRPEDTP